MFDRAQSTIANVDPELWTAIQQENRRQEEHIELIASENYASPGRDGGAGLASSPTSTPKAIPASATTAAANTSTSPSSSRSTA